MFLNSVRSFFLNDTAVLINLHHFPTKRIHELPIHHIHHNPHLIPLSDFDSAEQLTRDHLLRLKRRIFKLLRPAFELAICRHYAVREEFFVVVLVFQLRQRLLIFGDFCLDSIKCERQIFLIMSSTALSTRSALYVLAPLQSLSPRLRW